MSHELACANHTLSLRPHGEVDTATYTREIRSEKERHQFELFTSFLIVDFKLHDTLEDFGRAGCGALAEYVYAPGLSPNSL